MTPHRAVSIHRTTVALIVFRSRPGWITPIGGNEFPHDCLVCMYVWHYIWQSMDQPGKVANPARGQLDKENNIPLAPCVRKNLVSRDRFSRPVPRQPAHLHIQAESDAYLRYSFRVPRRRPFMKPPYAIESAPSLSGHASAYRWRSLPRVRGHRASKPQGSSERMLPWQITMDQLIFASPPHTHYWYEVGMLKVPYRSPNTFPDNKYPIYQGNSRCHTGPPVSACCRCHF